jgi:hypothetical protein
VKSPLNLFILWPDDRWQRRGATERPATTAMGFIETKLLDSAKERMRKHGCKVAAELQV